MKTFALAIIVTLTFFSSTVYSQKKDYIVTLTGDTILGNIIGPRFYSGNVYYRIKPELLNAYFNADANQIFRSRTLPGKVKKTFVQCVEQGKICLYEIVIYDKSGSSGQRNIFEESGLIRARSSKLYAEKDSSGLVIVKTDQFLRGNKDNLITFHDLISDNPEIVNLVNGKKNPSNADVQFYIHEYNMKAKP